MQTADFKNFEEFWPYYLCEHRNVLNRRLHFVGTTLVNLILLGAIAALDARWLLACPVAGYGFAWAGHFLVEKNRPATFRHPLWSLRGDYRMYRYMLSGRLWGPATS